MGQVSGLAGELNFVVSYWWNGCATPFNLMVECAREPAGEVALVFLSTGLDDIVRSFTRPGHGGHRRTSKKNRGNRKGYFKGVPEISDMVAGRFPGVEDWRKRDVQQGVRSLWKLDGLIQAVTWNVVVVELASDFTFKTVLGMLQLKQTKCDVPGRAYIQGKDLDPFNNGQWFALPFQEVLYQQYPVTVNPLNMFFDDGNYYQVLSEVVAYNPTNTDGDVQWEFRVAAAEGGGIYQSAVHPVPRQGVASDMFAVIIKGPGYIQLYQRSHADLVFPNHYIVGFPSMFTDL